MNTNVVCPKCKADNCTYNDTCIKCDTPLVGDEVRILDKTADLWNAFLKLTDGHPDERNEFKLCVHRMQDILSARMAAKLTEGIFKTFRDSVKNAK